MMKACPKCTGVISESAYFGAWMCDKCDYKKSFRIGNLDKRDSRIAELEAENQELRVWVREALLKFTGTRIAVVFTDDRCAECYFCHGSVPRSAKESIPHAATCIITRGEKLLLEGADKEEVI